MTSTIDLGALKLPLTDEFIENDDDYLINVRVPKKYSQVPQFSHSLGEKYHIMTFDDINDYFTQILSNQSMRITFVNGIEMSNSMSYYCDYCGADIEDDYYYCYNCHNDMCRLCFSETSQEIATANGAQNYENRKDQLEICRNKHKLVSRKNANAAICNLCNENTDHDDLLIKTEKRYHNKVDDYDLCLKCSETEQGQNIIKEKNLQLIDNLLSCHVCDFGSFLDWVPLLRDDTYNMILCNLNPESPYHMKYAISSVDDHGRTGYYTITEQTTIETLITEIEMIIRNRQELKVAIEKMTSIISDKIKLGDDIDKITELLRDRAVLTSLIESIKEMLSNPQIVSSIVDTIIDNSTTESPIESEMELLIKSICGQTKENITVEFLIKEIEKITSDEIKIKSIIKELKDLVDACDEAFDEEENGWHEFYNMPIKILMSRRNMRIHYG